jgi:uncharacterized protein YjbI with pentapeptide repeats
MLITNHAELDTVLAAHKLWRVAGGEAGKRANLAGADLARAYLEDADLAGADLARANLEGANLEGANLARANLEDAYLEGANLARANLAGAYLEGANLARANLAGAFGLPTGDTTGPAEPYVRRPNPEQRAARVARYRALHPEIPVIEALDRKILDAVTVSDGHLDMASWHTCETTHCRAGWAITLGGEAGKKLEKEHGPFLAGCMIYRASTGRVPYFFATTEEALADIKRCAEAGPFLAGLPEEP